MRLGFLRRAVACALAVLAMCGASRAAAELPDIPLEPVCQMGAQLAENPLALAAASNRWDCDNPDYSLAAARNLLRFVPNPAHALPRFLSTRSGTFSAIEIYVIDRDGSVGRVRRTMADARPQTAGPTFSVTLPPVKRSTQSIIVAFDRVWAGGMLSDARLTATTAAAGWTIPAMLLAAAICGLL